LTAGEKSAEGILVLPCRMKAQTVEGKPPGRDKLGTASVKAEHCYPRGEGMKPDWHTG